MRYLLLLLLSTLLSCKQENTVTLLYFNDAHEIMPVPLKNKKKGGVAKLKTLVDKINKEQKTIVVFGGDLAGGTLFGKVYKGLPMVKAFNQIPIDVANFGQHEFDYGLRNVEELVKKSHFQWITSNITHQNKQPLLQLPTHYIKESNGIRIGFLGITDKLSTSTKEKDVVQQDMIASAKLVVELLKNKRVDYIVAITQTPMKENKEIMNAVPEIDLILTEETSEEITEIQHFDNKYIVNAIGNMGSVVQVNLTKKEGKVVPNFKVHFLGDDISENAQLKEFAQKYQDSLEKKLAKKIGFSSQKIERKNRLQKESEMGNLIADAFKSHFNTDIGIVNGGGIRSSLPKGDITLKNIFAVLPFENKVEVVKLLGEEIVDMLKKGLKNYKNFGGEFLQVSGMSYEFVISDKNIPKLNKVLVAEKPIELNKEYTISLTNYIANGGGELDAILPQKRITPLKKRILDTDVLVKYIKQKDTLKPILEGRIRAFP